MKKIVLSSVAAAVGTLVAGMASAQVNIDVASPTTIKYASEMTPSSTASITLRHGAVANQTASVNTGATFANNAVGYIRIDVGGASFNGTPSPAMVSVATRAGFGTVAVAQSSTNFAVFSVTPGAGDQLVQNGTVTIDTDDATGVQGLGVTSKDGVTLRYRLYDNLADASNGSSNSVKDTGAKAYISFATSFSSTFTAGSAIADVSATAGAYNTFTAGTQSGANANTAAGGRVAFAFDVANVADRSGAAFTSAIGLAATGTTVVVTAITGNFNFAANANGGFDTLSRVRFTDGANCDVGTQLSANSITSSAATFTNVPASFFASGTTQRLCLTARSGTPAATIGAGTYQLSTTLAPSTASVYGGFANPTSTASFTTITQNGATIFIPLAQVPSGYLPRIALTNTSTNSRGYTITAITESGTTVALSGAAASGTLPAGSLTVIDLSGNMTVTGAAPRSSLRIVVNAPASEIRAVYQLTNAATGSVSNQALTVE